MVFDAKAWYAYLQSVKKALQSLKDEPPSGNEYITAYPASPTDLPPAIFAEAYPGERGPAMNAVDGMDCPDFLRRSSA